MKRNLIGAGTAILALFISAAGAAPASAQSKAAAPAATASSCQPCLPVWGPVTTSPCQVGGSECPKKTRQITIVPSSSTIKIRSLVPANQQQNPWLGTDVKIHRVEETCCPSNKCCQEECPYLQALQSFWKRVGFVLHGRHPHRPKPNTHSGMDFVVIDRCHAGAPPQPGDCPYLQAIQLLWRDVSLLLRGDLKACQRELPQAGFQPDLNVPLGQRIYHQAPAHRVLPFPQRIHAVHGPHSISIHPRSFVPPIIEKTGALTDNVEALRRLAQARKMYELADRLWTNGDKRAAYQYYQETHLLSPNSRYGQIANQRLARIESEIIRKKLSASVNTQVQHIIHSVSHQVPALQLQSAPTADELYLRKLAQAQEMYHIGERCRKKGDLDKAYTCYHETKRICPNSDYARRASEHIQRIDALRNNDNDAEAAEKGASDKPVEGELLPSCPLTLPFLPELLFHLSSTTAPQSERCTASSQSESEAQEQAVECPASPELEGFIESILQEVHRESSDSNPGPADNDPQAQEWLLNTLHAVRGDTHVELDVDTNADGGMRVRGGVYFGSLGCRVIYDRGDYEVVWPVFRGATNRQ